MSEIKTLIDHCAQEARYLHMTNLARMAAAADTELARKDAAIAAALYALKVSMWQLELTDDGNVVAYCAGCSVEREDLQSGVDKHADSCVVAEALAALAETGDA
jgi:hypothetical protein